MLIFALLVIVIGGAIIGESGSPVLLGIGLLLFGIMIPLGISCKSKSEQNAGESIREMREQKFQLNTWDGMERFILSC
jgi:hypothetical protein